VAEVNTGIDTQLSPYQAIKRVIETTNLSDPSAIAAKVNESLTTEQREEWFMTLLVPYTRNLMGTFRNRAMIAGIPVSDEPKSSEPAPIIHRPVVRPPSPPLAPTGPKIHPGAPSLFREPIHDLEIELESEPEPIVVEPVHRPAIRPANRSAKQVTVKNWWQQMLSSSILVGDAGWKRVADCDVKDLLAAAKVRREQASDSLLMASRLEAIAELLKSKKVDTVSQLSEKDFNALAV
jgi:hypothetical protein